MDKFDIYFSGRLIPEAEPAATKIAIGKLFKLDGPALERLFSGSRIRIKSGVDAEAASRLRAAFRERGALVEIASTAPSKATATAASQAQTQTQPQAKPAAEPKSEVASEPAPTAVSSLTMLPPNTGSLIDCHEPVQPVQIPDTGWMQLDEPGALMDRTPAVPSANFDVSKLSAGPPNSGSLADCQSPAKPRPIADISWMSLTEMGEILTPQERIPDDEFKLSDLSLDDLD